MLDAEHQSHGSMDGLEVAEKVVLWSVRTRLEGVASFDRIRQAFRRAYDATSADAAFGAFEPWFLILATIAAVTSICIGRSARASATTSARCWTSSRMSRPELPTALGTWPHRLCTSVRSAASLARP